MTVVIVWERERLSLHDLLFFFPFIWNPAALLIPESQINLYRVSWSHFGGGLRDASWTSLGWIRSPPRSFSAYSLCCSLSSSSAIFSIIYSLSLSFISSPFTFLRCICECRGHVSLVFPCPVVMLQYSKNCSGVSGSVFLRRWKCRADGVWEKNS